MAKFQLDFIGKGAANLVRSVQQLSKVSAGQHALNLKNLAQQSKAYAVAGKAATAMAAAGRNSFAQMAQQSSVLASQAARTSQALASFAKAAIQSGSAQQGAFNAVSKAAVTMGSGVYKAFQALDGPFAALSARMAGVQQGAGGVQAALSGVARSAVPAANALASAAVQYGALATQTARATAATVGLTKTGAALAQFALRNKVAAQTTAALGAALVIATSGWFRYIKAAGIAAKTSGMAGDVLSKNADTINKSIGIFMSGGMALSTALGGLPVGPLGQVVAGVAAVGVYWTEAAKVAQRTSIFTGKALSLSSEQFKAVLMILANWRLVAGAIMMSYQNLQMNLNLYEVIDLSMARIQTKLKASNAEMTKFQKTLSEISGQFGVLRSDLAAAADTLIVGEGMSFEEAEASLKNLSAVTASTGLMMAEVTRMMTEAASAMGSNNLAQTIDRVATAYGNSSTNLADMATALQLVGRQVLANTAETESSVLTLIGTLQSMGLDAQQSGGELAQTLGAIQGRIQQIAQEGADGLQKDLSVELNVSEDIASLDLFTNSLASTGDRIAQLFQGPAGEVRSLLEVLPELRAELAGMGEGEQGALLQSLFGQQGQMTIMTLLKASQSQIDQLYTQIESQTGEMDLAGPIENSYAQALARFQSALEDIQVKIAEAFEPVQTMFLNIASSVLELTEVLNPIVEKVLLFTTQLAPLFSTIAVIVGPIAQIWLVFKVLLPLLFTYIAQIDKGILAFRKMAEEERKLEQMEKENAQAREKAAADQKKREEEALKRADRLRKAQEEASRNRGKKQGMRFGDEDLPGATDVDLERRQTENEILDATVELTKQQEAERRVRAELNALSIKGLAITREKLEYEQLLAENLEKQRKLQEQSARPGFIGQFDTVEDQQAAIGAVAEGRGLEDSAALFEQERYLQERIEEAGAEYDKITDERQKLNRRQAKLEAEIEATNASIFDKQVKLQETGSRAGVVNAQSMLATIDQREREADQALLRATDSLLEAEKRVSTARQQLESARSERESVQGRKDATVRQYQGLRDEQAGLLESKLDLEIQLSTATGGEATKIQQQLDAIQNRIVEINQERLNAAKLEERLSKELEQQDKIITKRESKLSFLETEAGARQSDVNLEQQRQSYIAEQSGLMREAAAGGESPIRGLIDIETDAGDRLISLTRQIVQVTSQLDQKNAALDATQSRLDDLSETLSGAQSRLIEAESELASLEIERPGLSAQLTDIQDQKKIAEQQAFATGSEQDIAIYQEIVKQEVDVSNQLRENQKRAAELTAERESLRSVESQVSAEIAEQTKIRATQRVEQKRTAIELRDAQNAETIQLERQLQARTALIELRAREGGITKKQRQQIEAELAVLERERDALQKGLNADDLDLEDLEIGITTDVDEVKRLLSEIQTLDEEQAKLTGTAVDTTAQAQAALRMMGIEEPVPVPIVPEPVDPQEREAALLSAQIEAQSNEDKIAKEQLARQQNPDRVRAQREAAAAAGEVLAKEYGEMVADAEAVISMYSAAIDDISPQIDAVQQDLLAAENELAAIQGQYEDKGKRGIEETRAKAEEALAFVAAGPVDQVAAKEQELKTLKSQIQALGMQTGELAISPEPGALTAYAAAQDQLIELEKQAIRVEQQLKEMWANPPADTWEEDSRQAKAYAQYLIQESIPAQERFYQEQIDGVQETIAARKALLDSLMEQQSRMAAEMGEAQARVAVELPPSSAMDPVAAEQELIRQESAGQMRDIYSAELQEGTRLTEIAAQREALQKQIEDIVKGSEQLGFTEKKEIADFIKRQQDLAQERADLEAQIEANEKLAQEARQKAATSRYVEIEGFGDAPVTLDRADQRKPLLEEAAVSEASAEKAKEQQSEVQGRISDLQALRQEATAEIEGTLKETFAKADQLRREGIALQIAVEGESAEDAVNRVAKAQEKLDKASGIEKQAVKIYTMAKGSIAAIDEQIDKEEELLATLEKREKVERKVAAAKRQAAAEILDNIEDQERVQSKIADEAEANLAKQRKRLQELVQDQIEADKQREASARRVAEINRRIAELQEESRAFDPLDEQYKAIQQEIGGLRDEQGMADRDALADKTSQTIRDKDLEAQRDAVRAAQQEAENATATLNDQQRRVAQSAAQAMSQVDGMADAYDKASSAARTAFGKAEEASKAIAENGNIGKIWGKAIEGGYRGAVRTAFRFGKEATVAAAHAVSATVKTVWSRIGDSVMNAGADLLRSGLQLIAADAARRVLGNALRGVANFFLGFFDTSINKIYSETVRKLRDLRKEADRTLTRSGIATAGPSFEERSAEAKEQEIQKIKQDGNWILGIWDWMMEIGSKLPGWGKAIVAVLAGVVAFFAAPFITGGTLMTSAVVAIGLKVAAVITTVLSGIAALTAIGNKSWRFAENEQKRRAKKFTEDSDAIMARAREIKLMFDGGLVDPDSTAGQVLIGELQALSEEMGNLDTAGDMAAESIKATFQQSLLGTADNLSAMADGMLETLSGLINFTDAVKYLDTRLGLLDDRKLALEYEAQLKFSTGELDEEGLQKEMQRIERETMEMRLREIEVMLPKIRESETDSAQEKANKIRELERETLEIKTQLLQQEVEAVKEANREILGEIEDRIAKELDDIKDAADLKRLAILEDESLTAEEREKALDGAEDDLRDLQLEKTRERLKELQDLGVLSTAEEEEQRLASIEEAEDEITQLRIQKAEERAAALDEIQELESGRAKEKLDAEKELQEEIAQGRIDLQDELFQNEKEFALEQQKEREEFELDLQERRATFQEDQQKAQADFEKQQQEEKAQFEKDLQKELEDLRKTEEERVIDQAIEREKELALAKSEAERAELRKKYKEEDEQRAKELEAELKASEEVEKNRDRILSDAEKSGVLDVELSATELRRQGEEQAQKEAEFAQQQLDAAEEFKAQQEQEALDFEQEIQDSQAEFEQGQRDAEIEFLESQRQLQLDFENESRQQWADFWNEQRKLDRDNAEAIAKIREREGIATRLEQLQANMAAQERQKKIYESYLNAAATNTDPNIRYDPASLERARGWIAQSEAAIKAIADQVAAEQQRMGQIDAELNAADQRPTLATLDDIAMSEREVELREQQAAERAATQDFNAQERERDAQHRAEQRRLDWENAKQIYSIYNQPGNIVDLGGLPARREGGPVAAGQTYLVGEEGPELFTPGRAGGILPADQTAALMGGLLSNRPNIYAPTPATESLRELQQIRKALSGLKPGVGSQQISIRNSYQPDGGSTAAMVERSQLDLLRQLQKTLG